MHCTSLLQVDSRPGRKPFVSEKPLVDHKVPLEPFGKETAKEPASSAVAAVSEPGTGLETAALLQEGATTTGAQLLISQLEAGAWLLHYLKDGGGTFTIVAIVIVLFMGLAMGLFVYFHHQHRPEKEKLRPGPASAPPQQAREERPRKSPPVSQRSHEPAPAAQQAAPPPRPVDNRILCKELVVPEGTECVLAVPITGLESTRRSRKTFDITDKKGKTLLKVALEIPKGPSGHMLERLTLQSASAQDALASCDILIPVLNRGSGGPKIRCSIQSKTGDLFGRIDFEAQTSDTGQCYEMIGVGGTWHVSFYGNLGEHSLNVTNDKSQLLATVEQANLSFASPGSYYQLRVAPLSDAGLILIALLALDRMFAASSRP